MNPAPEPGKYCRYHNRNSRWHASKLGAQPVEPLCEFQPNGSECDGE